MNHAVAPALVLFFVFVLGVNGALVRAPGTSRAQSSLSNKEKTCLNQEKVLHSDGKCYPLLWKGPCQADHWLTLAGEVSPPGNRDRYVCSPRPCENTRQFYWPEDGQCHSASDVTSLCPHEGTRLRNDVYGDGECACKPAHAQYKPRVMMANRSAGWDGQGKCYPLFWRGPCPEGKILHPEVLEGFGIVAKCVTDYCSFLNVNNPGESYVMHVTDHRCYRLGSRIAVCQNNTFDVHPSTNLPGCHWPIVTDVLSAFSDTTARCGGGNNIDPTTGNCRGVLDLDNQFSQYIYEATGRVKPKRRTRKGT